MGKLLLVRHGESLANRAGIYQGQSVDTSLSVLGKKQAVLVAVRLKDMEVACVFTSPLKRTKETATTVADYGDKKLIEDRRLLEINHGRWEGKQKEAVILKWPRLFGIWKKVPTRAQMPGGENLSDVTKRVSNFVRDLERNYRNKTVAIVSHDVILRVLICKALGLSLSRLWSFELDNGSLSVLSFGRRMGVLTLNETIHLKHYRGHLDKQAL